MRRPGRLPLVSTIIAVYNGETYLEEAVKSALSQSYTSHEIVVVDDGSTDSTPDIIASFGDALRSIRQANAGVSAARNRGISAAHGELIAFLDADDLWLPRKLERQVALYLAQPETGFIYCGYFVTDARLRVRYGVPVLAAGRRVNGCLTMDAWGIGLPLTGVVPRAVIESSEGFRSELSTSADADLLARIASQYPVAAVREPLALYRSHPKQMHRDPSLMERDVADFLNRMEAGGFLSASEANRGRANLHLRLAVQRLARGDMRQGVGHLREVARRGPARLVMAPAMALLRRLVYRLSAMVYRGSSPRSLRG